MIHAIEKHAYQDVCHNLGNVLESVTLNIHPEVANIKDQMKQFEQILLSNERKRSDRFWFGGA